MSIEVMKQALEALDMLARYENPETKIQVRKPKDGGPIVTMYPHKVATEAAQSLRLAIEQAERQEPFGYFRYDLRLDAWVQNRESNKGVAFYTAPPQRQPLTRKDVLAIIDSEPAYMITGLPMFYRDQVAIIVRKVERKHGIGGEHD